MSQETLDIAQPMDVSPSKTLPQFPRQGTWTYEDWLKFPNDGWKYEIIDGVLYMTPPPATAHQGSSVELSSQMHIYAKENDLGRILVAPCGVHLPKQPVPVEPDIFFIKKERLHIIHKNYVEGVPDLIVEILSPSNPNHDRKTKFALYQNVGIPEYWLVNYRDKTVEVYTLARDGYSLVGKYGPGDVVKSEQLAGFKMVVGSIFDF